MSTGFTKIARADVREQFLYPPVGRTERQWDLFVEGAGEGTWPSETDPVWHPQPFYCRWETGRVLNGVSLGYVTEGEGELESEAAPRTMIAPGCVFLTFPGVWHRYRALPGTQWSYYFRELFKRHTGTSPYQYHLARRLDRAQTLLAESELTIKEVAAALHFNDAYHFSKTFKARTGRSPSRWRQA
jgi:hypothetical protein